MKQNKFSKSFLALLMVGIITCLSIFPTFATSEITSETSETTSETSEITSEVTTETPESSETTETIPTYPMTITVTTAKGTKLEGLEFSVTDQNGNPLQFVTSNENYSVAENGFYKTIKSDANGKIKLTGLKAGTYTISYTNNNPEYALSADSKITVDTANNSATIQLKENIGDFIFTLTSEDSVSIKGAKFQIKDVNNNILNFAYKNGVYVPATVGNNVIETNTAGKFTINNLPVGDYVLIQTEAPVEFNGALVNKNFTITIGNQTKITEINTKEYGNLKLNVTDSQTSTALVKSEFNIVDKNGNKVFFNGTDGQYTFSRTDGVDIIKTGEAGSLIINGLPVGEYSVVEVVSPKGYDKAENATIKIEKNKDTAVTIKNVKSAGTLEINVSDYTTKEPVSNYTFTLTDSNNNLVKFTKKSDGVYTYATNGTETNLVSANGKITLTDIPVGTYTVKQVKAANGYIIDGVAIQQTITSQETTSYSVEVSKSNASLTVVGEEGQPIKGIKVQFKDTSGNIVFEGETNDNGKILITGVAAGSYSYIINNLPSPYINKTYSQTFSINQKGEVEGLDSCVLEHTKVLVTLKDKLEGAVFQLVNKADNSKTYTATTNEEGVATFVKVEDGEYTLTQVEAPEGYTLSTQEETIVLNRDSKATLSFNFENKTASTEDEIIPGEPEDPEEPVEKKGNKIIIAVCIILLVLGATVYAVIKTKKDDDQEHDNDDSDNDNNVDVAPVVPTTPAPAKEEKPKKVKEVKTPKIQKAPKVKEVKVEPPVATPVVPEEKPVRPAGPAFYMEDEDEDEDEFMPDIELSRPAVDDFNFDPYEQEELEKVQEEIQETVQSVLEENTSEIDLDITKEEAPTMELPEIELPVEEAPVVEAPATEVVDEDDDDDDGYDLSYLFAEMMQNSSEETGEDLQDETTPANQGKDTSDNN